MAIWGAGGCDPLEISCLWAHTVLDLGSKLFVNLDHKMV